MVAASENRTATVPWDKTGFPHQNSLFGYLIQLQVADQLLRQHLWNLLLQDPLGFSIGRAVESSSTKATSWAVVQAQNRDSMICDETPLSKQVRWNILMSLITSIQGIYTVALSSPVISPWNSPHQYSNFIISMKPQFRSPLGGRGGAVHPREASSHKHKAFQRVECHGRSIYRGHKEFTSRGICQEFHDRWHAQQGCVSPWKQQAVKLCDSSHSNVFCLPRGEQPAMSNADKMHIQKNYTWAKSYWHIQTRIYRKLPKCWLKHMNTHCNILVLW